MAIGTIRVVANSGGGRPIQYVVRVLGDRVVLVKDRTTCVLSIVATRPISYSRPCGSILVLGCKVGKVANGAILRVRLFGILLREDVGRGEGWRANNWWRGFLYIREQS